MRQRVVVSGSVAQRPLHGGHAWVFLQYLLGFRKLGWEVLFLDRLDRHMSLDGANRPVPPARSHNLLYLRKLMERFGLGEDYAVLCEDRAEPVGRSRSALLEEVAAADVFLNFMGFCVDAAVLEAARRPVFVDIDPGFPQMWRELGLHDPFAGHDAFVTVGWNVGRPDCLVPSCGLEWIPTRPPVVLEEWPAAPSDGPFTTVATWRGEMEPIEYRGRTFGLRVHEFRRFVSLPRHTPGPFQIALDIHPADEADRRLLCENDWQLVDPREVAGDPIGYRDYIRGSGAEFTVAKELYVATRGGWFSDRSACYLASGRPVVTRDTGLSDVLPGGEGLFLYSSQAEAAAAVEAIRADRPRHSRAARDLAHAFFDSDEVLPRLAEAVAAWV